jgi:molybdopterin molybdotransferase
VALISTGDEIVLPEQTPKPGEVRNINQYSLRAMISEAGGEPLDLGVVKDDRPAFEKAMTQALKKADVVMISGGSSVGTKDMTVDVICSFPRSAVFFHGISIAPGKPTIFAKAAGKPVMGLPGHPVSALVVFSLFGAPLIRLLGGEPAVAAFAPPRTTRAALAQNIASAPGREDYIRVFCKGRTETYSPNPYLASPARSSVWSRPTVWCASHTMKKEKRRGRQ